MIARESIQRPGYKFTRTGKPPIDAKTQEISHMLRPTDLKQ